MSAGSRWGTSNWQSADAARFLYKAQCYDAGSDSETKCGLCGEQIRLCYVVKVLRFPDPLSPEIGKLTIGECCFESIESVNRKLYLELLAAAVNLRTYIEAIERDQRIFGDPAQPAALEKVESQRLEVPRLKEDMVRQLLEALANDGGDHA